MKATIQSASRTLPQTDLYGITAESYSKERNNIAVVEEMIAAGIRIIQYREKEKSMHERYIQCQKIREITREAGAFFIVNDHVDLAMMVEADGIHIGQDDYPLQEVRRLVGPEMVIGLSTHSPAQATAAIDQGANYIGVGPIFQTFTKKDVCDPVGFEYLEWVVAQKPPIPFVTIGGIKAHNIAEVIKRGATCTALVTEIVGADDIARKIKEIRMLIRRAQAL